MCQCACAVHSLMIDKNSCTMSFYEVFDVLFVDDVINLADGGRRQQAEVVKLRFTNLVNNMQCLCGANF